MEKKVDAILIDEAQFLSPEEVDTLSDIVDFYEIPVLCYGLRADFQTHLFPGSRRLMEIADIIEEVPTVCWCGKRAQCNTRYANGKIVQKARRFSLDRMRAMWRSAGNIIKKESCGRKMSEIRIQEVKERAPLMDKLVELWETSVRDASFSFGCGSQSNQRVRSAGAGGCCASAYRQK